MNKRYETVLKWFREYGFTIIKENNSTAYWCETEMIDKKGNKRIFEITNNHIWFMSKHKGRTSFGKTKTELYYNLEKRGW